MALFWTQALPAAEKEEYRELCRLENRLIDDAVADIDRDIISLRPERKEYNGATPTLAAVGGDGKSDDIWFNPVYW